MSSDHPAVSRIVFHPRAEAAHFSPAGRATATDCGDAILGGYLHHRPETAALLLFFHGNGEVAADYDALARFYTACGISLWVLDYRGYGRSTGTPAYSHLLADATAVLEDVATLEQELNRTFTRVIVMGRSLGSAPAIFLAAAHSERVHALILDSPFADGPALIRRLGGPVLAAADLPEGADNIDRMAGVHQPCLLIHGSADRIIPLADAEALHAACPSRRKKLVTVAGAGHNDLLMRGFDDYFAEIAALVEAVGGRSDNHRG